MIDSLMTLGCSDGAEIVQQVLRDEETLVLLVGGTVGAIGIVFGCATAMVKATAREKTRREIAAYIAEGAMTPEQGERLMRAGRNA